MTLREFLTAWFTDACTRHPQILHTTQKASLGTLLM